MHHRIRGPVRKIQRAWGNPFNTCLLPFRAPHDPLLSGLALTLDSLPTKSPNMLFLSISQMVFMRKINHFLSLLSITIPTPHSLEKRGCLSPSQPFLIFSLYSLSPLFHSLSVNFPPITLLIVFLTTH